MTLQLAREKTKTIPRWKTSSQRSESTSGIGKLNEEKRFATVAIPDIRQQSEFLETGRVETAIDQEANVDEIAEDNSVPGPTSSLRKIKTAIERSLEHANQSEYENSIRELKATISTPEPNPKQTETKTPTKKRKAAKQAENCSLAKLNPKDPQLQSICDSLLERTPGCGAKIVTFTSSEENEQLPGMVMGTAVAIQARNKFRLLIIDSDFDDKSLSIAMDCEKQTGLADIGKGGNSIEQLIESTSNSEIDILSVGKNSVTDTSQLSTIVRKALIAIGNDYDYVFVNIGEAHSHVAQCWAEYTDGTFLLVNMKTSCQEIAKSAVSQLNSFGARLIGCIVSSVDD